jgi:glutamate synthase domain-containing protein 2
VSSPRDPNVIADEPWVEHIHELAEHGLSRSSPHGPIDSLGVRRSQLPSFDDLQIVTAQLARLPLLDDEPVATDVVVGPRARRPLHLGIPLVVADMAYGSISAEAKLALSRGAELAGTGICTGEAGALAEEEAACRRILLQLGSARWGWDERKLDRAQAFHIKLGQAAKTGAGGLLVGEKVVGRVAEMHGATVGTTLVAPSRDPAWHGEADHRAFVDHVRERSGGIPIGVKLSAQHIEDDIAAAVRIGVDYIILDGRGGGTAAAPILFRDHIGVPTMAAIGRARRTLDALAGRDVTLIVSGGLRMAPDFVKALALGADAVALGSSALQAIGCLGIRACHTDTCPVGIATQREDLRARLVIDEAAARLGRFLAASVEQMKALARACGHASLAGLARSDLTSWRREIADLAGVRFAGAGG